MNRASALPLLVVCLLYGIVGPSPLAVAFAVATLLPQLLKQKPEVSTAGQLVVGIPAFIIAIIVIATVFPQPSGAILELRTPWRAFGGACLVAGMLRQWVAKPVGGEPATIACSLLALTACGGTFRHDIYPFFVVAYLLAAALARREGDAGAAPLKGGLRARGWTVAVLVAITGLSLAGWMTALPRIHARAVQAMLRRRMMPSVGFTDRMSLGALKGLIESDRRVLRVKDPTGTAAGALLRGVVYDQYAGGRWSYHDSFRQVEPSPIPRRDVPMVEVEILDDEPKRYFIPWAAADVAVSSGIARRDALGVLSPIAAEPASRIWYRPAVPRAYDVRPPMDEDVSLPRTVGAALRPFAMSWSEEAKTDREVVEAIERRLRREHSYSLESDYQHYSDPVVGFVMSEEGGGHCEYFASALALMVRTRGIPARVIGGYRVVEKNPLGDYFVVRERDAHAWVEVWLRGEGWVTFDPTPAVAALPSRLETGFFSGLWDLAGSRWLGFLDWLDERTPLEMVTPPILLITLAVLLRVLRRRREQDEVVEGPLPSFAALTDALGERGVRRRPHETPLQLAARLDEASLGEIAGEIAAWLERYSALRYGGRGDPDALAEEARALVVALDR